MGGGRVAEAAAKAAAAAAARWRRVAPVLSVVAVGVLCLRISGEGGDTGSQRPGD